MAGVAAKTLIVTAARLLTRLSQLVYFVLLARVLSPERFGAYGVLTSAVFLASVIGNFGLRQASAQMVGRRTLSDGEAGATSLLIWPFLAMGTCLALWWLNRDQFAPLTIIEAMSIFVATVAVLLIALLQGVLLGRGETSAFAIADTGPRLLHSVFAITLWLLGILSLGTALLTFAFGFLIFVPWIAVKVFRNAKRRRVVPSKLLPMLGAGFVYALSLFLISLQGRLGLFFLSGADAAHQVGQFFAAQRATEIFLDVATASAVVLFSETARAEDPSAAFAAAMRAAIGLFVTFALLGVGVAVAAPAFVRIVLGPAYVDAEHALVVLSIGLGPAAFARVLNSVVSGMGRPWISATIAILGLAVNFALCSLTATRWGAVGASYALVLGQVACCIAYLMVAKIVFGLSIRASLPRFDQIGARVLKKLRRRPA